MSTLPLVTGTGTLTADPELRFTPGGAAVANVNIAFNSRRKNKQTDEWEDGDTTFLRGSIWKDYAENVAESLTKGDKVFLTGNLKQRSYEKDGQTRTVYELDITEIGPVLKWATASVTRASKGGNGGGQRSAQPAAQDDPWGSASTGSTDEPGW
jgi:single-strand DNA-binding protein